MSESSLCPLGCVPQDAEAILTSDFRNRLVPGLNIGALVGIIIASMVFIICVVVAAIYATRRYVPPEPCGNCGYVCSKA